MADLRYKDYFLFTQHSLVTFNKCPLKFKKKYLDGLKWETFPDESVRKNIKRGLDFHLLANRYFMGIDPGLWEDIEEFNDMNFLLKNLKEHFRLAKETLYLPEFKLRYVNEIIKLEANYDLIMIGRDYIYIYDWKTRNSESELNLGKMKKRFSESLQTIVYMYVLYEQIAQLRILYLNKFGVDISLNNDLNIAMIYWMPEEPFELTRIEYTNNIHKRFAEIITAKIKKILEYNFENFSNEEYKKQCRYCEFNWFCNNEKVNFKAINNNDEFLEEIDWDDISELF